MDPGISTAEPGEIQRTVGGRCPGFIPFLLDTQRGLRYNRPMYDEICRRLAYWTTSIPLPSIALALILGSIANGSELGFPRHLATGLLVISGIAYLLSLFLTIAYGFMAKKSRILLTPTASLLLIALFVVFLPQNVRENPWRTVDVVTFAGLALLNVMQIVMLRQQTHAIRDKKHHGIV